MIIYKDITNGDELVSDSFGVQEKDGVVYEVNCKNIKVGGESVDIGANPSAEEGDEGTDDAAATVLDVVYSMRLQEYGTMDKKGYQGHLKDYFKKVKEGMRKNGASEDEVKDFEKKAAPVAKKILSEVSEYQFYMGESMDPEGMLIPFRWREGEVEPFCMFWKHGLKEEKV